QSLVLAPTLNPTGQLLNSGWLIPRGLEVRDEVKLGHATSVYNSAPPMSAFHIWTIGCQMNVADSRRLAESLEKYGLVAAEGPHNADVVVLYSCVVRQQAEDRVHGQLHALQQMKAARPHMKVVVAGCVSDIPDWRHRYPFVVLIAEPGHDLTVRDRLVDLLDLSERYRFDPEQAVRVPGISEGVTIHQGCNRSCTYCIVPSTRGGERSRPPAVVLDEVRG